MLKPSSSTRPAIMLALLASLGGAWFAGVPCTATARAAGPKDVPSDGRVERWHVAESDNFRILNYGPRPLGRSTAEVCERLRAELSGQWLSGQWLSGQWLSGQRLSGQCPSGANQTAWRPKCEVVLHPTDQAYLDEVGRGGRQTVASALVDRQDGRVLRRRIDVRATRPDWQSAALGHELVHVVLADRFGDAALPRWLDEGMAILADSREKQRRHRHSLERAMAAGTHFRLAELVALGDYPPAERWGAFYGQSASVVEYLVAQRGHARFVEFVELALERGYDHALRKVYGLADLGELERRWHGQVFAPASAARDDSRSQRVGAASQAARAG
jgi:hypothetical protein